MHTRLFRQHSKATNKEKKKQKRNRPPLSTTSLRLRRRSRGFGSLGRSVVVVAMADKTLSKDLRLAEAKRSGFRDAVQHLHERASSLLLLSLQWKDVEDHYEATQAALERREREVRSVEETISACFRGFEVRLEQIERREGEMAEARRAEAERRRTEVERRTEELEAARRAIEERLRGVEAAEKRFEEVSGSLGAMIDERLREVKEREKEIELKSEKLREGWEAFEASRSKLDGKINEVRLKSEEFEGKIKKLELKEKECDERVKQARLKEKRLQEWSNELEMQKRELEVRLREIELKDNKVKELSKELDLRSKKSEELEGKINEVRLKSEEFDGRIKNLELIEKECDERVKQARLKERSLQEWSNELEMQKRELEVRLREVELKDNRVKELSKELDLRSKKCEEQNNNNMRPMINKSNDEIYTKELAKSPDTACLMTIVDGKDLQIFLNERWTEGEKLRHELSAMLRKYPDPARLVLDAMEGFYPPHLKKGDVEFDECVVRRSCILLLEQLMKISPIITPQVKNEAMKLSFSWMTKMRADAENSMEVLGFLQLLATYGLPSSFDTDEILHYVEKIVRLWALRIRFQMEDEFPTEPLLKEYMRTSKNAAGAIFHKGHNSPEAQNQAMKSRVADLKAGGKCVEDHKIKSTVSRENIKQAITSLEKQNGEPKKAATEISSIEMRELDGKLHSPAIVAAPAPSSIPASVKTTSAITSETTVKPAPETSTPPQHKGKHPQTASLAEVGLNPLAGASSNAQSSHITHEDPASLVLNTLKYTDPSNSGEFIRLGIPAKHRILLLEHLKRFSPIIKPQLNQESKQFCAIWKLKLKAGKDDHMEIICFLQFLAAFKLAPLVAANEVLKLLDPSEWAKQVPDSCESLGLAEFLPGFIRNLIEKKHWIDAIKYINALKMEDKFPLGPLLTEYLAYWEKRADEISKKQDNSPSSQIGAINKKLSATKTAMKWIATYRLESEFSHKDFEAYIKRLEMQKAEIEGKLRESEADCSAGSQNVLTQHDKKKEPPPAQTTSDHVATSCGGAPLTVTTSTAPTSATSSRHQPQKKQGKKRKRIASQPQTPKDPPSGGYHSMRPNNRHPIDTHRLAMRPPYSARSSGYYGVRAPPHNYPFDPYPLSGIDRYHGRTYAVPLCGGRPVRLAGPRAAHNGPRW
ncbi:hypothetical protein BT93_B1487 [Corymbia citriodora subsp. variegata]|nr:hypothetical protein BT93_B1487 [Corymbia citriodora subsp. variegata]